VNESDIYTFIGEVRAELRAIRALLESHQAETSTRLDRHDDRIKSLEDWKANLMGRFTIVAIILSAAGAVILALLN
jgi:hypothetical protein